MPTLYILCGPSGCGKTTWAYNFMKKDQTINDIRYVSRDEIRFKMLNDNDDYFAHEKEVFKKFTGTIIQTLVDGFDCIADATHLNMRSRKRLTNAIDMKFKDYTIVYITFNVNINTCLTRNTLREGRAQAPENIIRNMYNDFHAPTKDEDSRVIDIWEIGE